MFELNYTLISFAGGLAIAIATAGWWLREQLQKVSDKVFHWLDVHENQDQKRHEENLIRLTRLETKLDIIKNGH